MRGPSSELPLLKKKKKKGKHVIARRDEKEGPSFGEGENFKIVINPHVEKTYKSFKIKWKL